MCNKERAIQLLDQIPENKMYYVIDFLEDLSNSKELNKSMEGLRTLQSFAGTLPQNFDYNKELEEARNQKYDSFN